MDAARSTPHPPACSQTEDETPVQHCLAMDQAVVRDADSPGTTLPEDVVAFVPRAPCLIDACTNTDRPHMCCAWLRRWCRCPPHGRPALLITKVVMAAVSFGVVWSITEKECLPGGNLFGVFAVFGCAVAGGKLVGFLHLPRLPPLPPLLGMLLAGVLLRNIPVVTEAIYIDYRWSASLRNIALSIILARAGLGLDAKALRKLRAVCVRLAVGPCLIEASTVALVSHFFMGLPWIWGFILGFVLGAVSPAVVVPSMLLLQKDGYGLEQGIPTLLMAAGSFDDILAITGFTTCLSVAFATGSTWFNLLIGLLEVIGGMTAGVGLGFFLRFFPSRDQKSLVNKRSFLLVGLCLFAVFGSNVFGFPGSGGLCTLVLAFLAGVGWGPDKVPVEDIVSKVWDVFQPLLFGLIGAEINIGALDPITVGFGLATLCISLTVRIVFTYIMVLCAGFNFREKLFVALAWMPKATVQAAIGSTALDMARGRQDEAAQHYGMKVLAVAVLSILITAPTGALLIGLCGPRLLQKPKSPEWAVSHGALSATDTPVTYESAI
ncbi:sodium/hydrogen exchanger 9B2 isoform X1 [Electrophorus electricus]|uniref:sodium/hydrogen exchanger 9B2 isoform X1 n=1 Tax=Electrophorus electricus TaxID=8005 RepID=UPI0015D06024|nr:sodium/hydrogen exchanger 9B2 isoform X1 [Electrophorus electricus]